MLAHMNHERDPPLNIPTQPKAKYTVKEISSGGRVATFVLSCLSSVEYVMSRNHYEHFQQIVLTYRLKHLYSDFFQDHRIIRSLIILFILIFICYLTGCNIRNHHQNSIIVKYLGLQIKLNQLDRRFDIFQINIRILLLYDNYVNRSVV